MSTYGRRVRGALAACFMFLGSCSEDTGGVAGATVLERTISALGGRDALVRLRRLEIEATGETFVSDQGTEVGGSAPRSSLFTQHLSVDLTAGLLRSDYVRTTFIPFSGAADYAEIVRGNLGYLTGTYLGLQPVPGPVPMEADRRSSSVRVQR